MAIIALHAIAKKRREIERRLAKGGNARRLRRELAHLDAAARLLNIPPQRRPLLPITRPILGALRTAPEPMTGRALTLMVMKTRGMDIANGEAVAAFRRRVDDTLYDLRKRGLLRTVGKRYGPLRWAVNLS